jgi:hypothetical protein
MTVAWRLRAGVLTLVGALAVHQARYAIAPPHHAHEQATHAYLSWAMPLVGALLFLAIAQLAVRVCRAYGDAAPELPGARLLWLAASASLVSVYVVQETVEMTVAHGHVPHLAEVLGDGGWVAVVLAASVGWVLALALRGAASVVRWALARAARRDARRTSGARLAPATPRLVPRGSVLACFLAGRAPPALSR